jgi:hypothetical protein
MDWLSKQNGFVSKIMHFCGLFLFIIIILDAYLETLNLASSFFQA